jgi:hypothetical protein
MRTLLCLVLLMVAASFGAGYVTARLVQIEMVDEGLR